MQQESVDHGSGTTTLTTGQKQYPDELRRKELAHFLRTRRAALSPEDVNLPATRRRRVRGLRREEVAEAAGISVAWYTWVEQARDITLSADTLERLSRSLHLENVERLHLYRLAGCPPPVAADGLNDDGGLLPSIQQLLESMSPNPAFVLDAMWNVLGWNDGSDEIFGFTRYTTQQRNMIRLILMDGTTRSLFTDWPAVARCMLGHFRADSAEHVGTANWQALVEELAHGQQAFAAWWDIHHVAAPYHWRKQVIHPTHGLMTYDTLDLQLAYPERYRIVTYIPVSLPSHGKGESAGAGT